MERGEFKRLSAFIDTKGVIRVGGRADAAVVSYETRHPVLLPNDHRVSLFIMPHANQYGHNGVATTKVKSRLRYWILRVTNWRKQVKKQCVFCKEMAEECETQVMSELHRCD